MIILLLSQTVSGKVFKVLKDLYSSPHFAMDATHICIWNINACKIQIYTIDNFQKIAEFGSKGEGPGDIRPDFGELTLYGNAVYVSQYPKLSIFSKKGNLLKIMTCTDAGGIIPVGQNFIGKKEDFQLKSLKCKATFAFFDSNLKKKRDSPGRARQIRLVQPK